MYQQGLGSRVSEARRVEWQGRIAAREEQAYGAKVRDIAAQLAVRFEVARQYDRGVKYLELAARNALARQRLHRGGAAVRQGDRHAASGPARRSFQGRAAHAAAASVAVVAAQGYATDEIEKIHATGADTRARTRRPADRGARAAQHLDDVRRARPAPPGAVARHRDLRPGRTHVRQGGAHAGARQARPDQLPSRRARHGARLFRECAGDLDRHAGRGTGARRGLPRLDACGISACPMPPAAWARRRCSWAARSRATMAWCSSRASPPGCTPSAASCAEAEAWSTNGSRCPRSTACRSGSPGAPA